MDARQWLAQHGSSGLGVPIAFFAVLAMMVLPIPAFLLDLFFTFSIAFSMIVLLAAIYTSRPLDFAVFPTVILLSTLLRLALNVASTRVVLLHGYEGPYAAGHVIQSFGEVVIGGNYAVGFVVFIILVIINFIVVTKGAGRISEVSARFTLDAMPGKQMAIDADLNAGLISQEDAKLRRAEVAMEADFYGAMDGASKFVRGDAIAGILILGVNLLGGIGIGTLQQSLPLTEAVKLYALLTIGDGLVAQIPALLLSTAAAIIVTRVSRSTDMGAQLSAQLFENPKILLLSGAVIGGLGVIPGMPHFAFVSLGGSLVAASFYLGKHQDKADRAEKLQAQQQAQQTLAEAPAPKEFGWDDVEILDPIGLEIGYRLVPLVNSQGGQLLGKIKGIRKKISQELGFLIPAVHIKDDLSLTPCGYRISLMGVCVAESQVQPEKDLAVNPGKVLGQLAGVETFDPVFQLPALWIEPSQREYAQSLGYTVVDASSVIATHLVNVVKKRSQQLFGHNELQHILQRIEQISEKLVEEVRKIPSSILVKTFQGLLAEQVPLKDVRGIAEVLAEHAGAPDPAVLIRAIRSHLKALIVQTIVGQSEDIPVVTLDPALEQILLNSIKMDQGNGPMIEPDLYNRIQEKVAQFAEGQEEKGDPCVFLLHPDLRIMMANLFKTWVHDCWFLSYAEIPDEKNLRIVGALGA